MKKQKNHRVSERRILIYRMLLLSVLVTVAVLFLAQFSPLVRGEGSENETIAVTKTDRGLITKAVFCFSENIVCSKEGGKVRPLLAEGAKIARGESGAEILVSRTNLTDNEVSVALFAEKAGLISYQFDGLETVLSPQSIGDISLFELIAKGEDYQKQAPKSFVKQGEAVYKTIENKKKPLLALCLPTNALAFLPADGKSADLFIMGEMVTAKILSRRKSHNCLELILELPLKDNWFQQRITEVEILIEELQNS